MKIAVMRFGNGRHALCPSVADRNPGGWHRAILKCEVEKHHV